MKKLFITLPIVFVLILVNIAVFSLAIPTIIVDETELVSLEVSAVDEDGDPLYFNFSEPLDEYGQWQTTYGDYGEYNVKVYVSDGEQTTEQEVLIIVNKVNWPPVLEPIDDITIKEGDKLILNPKVNDEEDDEIDIEISDPIGDDGEWQPDYEDAGEYPIIVTVSDGEHTASQEFTLIVTEVNRAPELESYYPEEDFSINEGEEIVLSISGIDMDGDSVKYLWYLDEKEVSELKTYKYKPNFDSAGMHEIKASVSDGFRKTTAVWNVEVLNANRAPEFKVVDEIVMNEADLLILEFEAIDPDGDEVEYTISDPIGDDGEWQTGYEDAGIYYVDVEVTDGDLTTTKTIELIVNNVDRAPLFEKINDFTADEGEMVTIELKSVDPDGTEIIFSAENLPEGAYIEENIFIYEIPYDVILKSEDGLFQKIHPKTQKEFIVTFSAAGNGASTEQDVKITVNDINLPPEMDAIDNVMINEGELVEVFPNVLDPDNDKISLSFSEPLDKDGKWQTTYEQSGIYTSTITVSDGELETSQEIVIVVNDINRAPVFSEMDNFEVNENALLSISPIVTDPDEDVIELSAENLPEKAVFVNGELLWRPDYDFCVGQDRDVIVTFVAVDTDNYETKQDVKITVKNNNRRPIIFDPKPSQSSIIAFTNRPVLFEVKTIDLDNDPLSFSWEFGGFNKIEDATPRLKRIFTEPGEKTVTLKVSDGTDVSTKIWKVRVIEGNLAQSTTTTTTAVSTPSAASTSSSGGTRTYIVDN
ncbi:PKD domain-containing protein [Candidatus Woesearchaeota archaeon]|nr:PKD domain-containing protein [Candidatus Woesearchaeota archaeon]